MNYSTDKEYNTINTNKDTVINTIDTIAFIDVTTDNAPLTPNSGASIEAIDYIRSDEIALLLDADFDTGLSDTTFWKKGTDTKQYVASLDPRDEYLRWYTQRPMGGLNNLNDSMNEPWMPREQFIKLFR